MSATWTKTLLYVLLTICAALVLYPVMYTFFMAVMTPEDASAYPPHIIPNSIDLSNFSEVFDIVPIGRFIGQYLSCRRTDNAWSIDYSEYGSLCFCENAVQRAKTSSSACLSQP